MALKILVCAQNEWYTPPIPCQARGGVDTVITLGGSVFLSVGTRGTPTLDAFLDKTFEEVAAQIQRFLDRHPDVSRETPAVVIMDIEKPHPADFHKHSTSIQRRLSRAFGIRAAAARRMLPKAKLGFYGTLVPDARGRAGDDRTWPGSALSSRRGSAACSTRRLPVPRRVPALRADRSHVEHLRAVHAPGGHRLEGAQRSDGTSLAVLPLLTYSIANKNSKNNHSCSSTFHSRAARGTLGSTAGRPAGRARPHGRVLGGRELRPDHTAAESERANRVTARLLPVIRARPRAAAVADPL